MRSSILGVNVVSTAPDTSTCSLTMWWPSRVARAGPPRPAKGRQGKRASFFSSSELMIGSLSKIHLNPAQKILVPRFVFAWTRGSLRNRPWTHRTRFVDECAPSLAVLVDDPLTERGRTMKSAMHESDLAVVFFLRAEMQLDESPRHRTRSLLSDRISGNRSGNKLYPAEVVPRLEEAWR